MARLVLSLAKLFRLGPKYNLISGLRDAGRDAASGGQPKLLPESPAGRAKGNCSPKCYSYLELTVWPNLAAFRFFCQRSRLIYGQIKRFTPSELAFNWARSGPGQEADQLNWRQRLPRNDFILETTR